VDGGLVSDTEARAVKVTLTNGRTDYIVYSSNPDTVYTVDGRIPFSGFFGVYSEIDGEPVIEYVNDGQFIGTMDSQPARITGMIADFTKDLSIHNYMDVEMDLSEVSLADVP